VENRKLSARHGWTRYSRHALATVASLIPRCRASNRVDQCVTPYFLGGGVSVAVTIRRWSIVRGRPDRGSSSSPASPCSAYRSRHPITVGRDTPRARPASRAEHPVQVGVGEHPGRGAAVVWTTRRLTHGGVEISPRYRLRDRRVRRPVRRLQHDPGPLRQPRPDRARASQPGQLRPVTLTQPQRRGGTIRHTPMIPTIEP
jgi:hypothetical protein